jgi:hypothetical protein
MLLHFFAFGFSWSKFWLVYSPEVSSTAFFRGLSPCRLRGDPIHGLYRTLNFVTAVNPKFPCEASRETIVRIEPKVCPILSPIGSDR